MSNFKCKRCNHEVSSKCPYTRDSFYTGDNPGKWHFVNYSVGLLRDGERGEHLVEMNMIIPEDEEDKLQYAAEMLQAMVEDIDLLKQALCRHEWEKIGPCLHGETCECFPDYPAPTGDEVVPTKELPRYGTVIV